MIRQTLLILWVVLSFQSDLLAQIAKGQHLLAITGMYQRENRDGLTPIVGGGSVYNISNEVRYTSAQYTPSLAYVLKKKWILGGGAEVISTETKINPLHKEMSINSGATVSIIEFTGRTTENSWAPFLFAEYIHPVGQKFYLSGIFSVNYALLKNTSKSEYSNLNPATGLLVVQISENKYRTESYAIRLSPAFRYQLRPHFGLQLNCGGFHFRQKVDDSRLLDYNRVRPSFGLEVAPRNWALGIYVNR